MVNLKQIEFLDKIFVRRPYFEASAYKVDNLRDVLKTNAFKNAIWLASPEFYKEIEKKGFDFNELNKKERLTALKFYNRMSFRGTPFGAFSAFGLADWYLDDQNQRPVKKSPLLHLLPSVQLELNKLETLPLTGAVLITVNPTLYKFSAGWRYSRYETDVKGKLKFFVYLLAYDQVDELLLACLTEKPMPFHDLINYLIELTDCTEDEAKIHVEKLLSEQVLISEHALSLIIHGKVDEHLSVEYNENLQLPDFIAKNRSGFENVDGGKSLYAGLELCDRIDLPVHWQQEIMGGLKVLDLLAPIPPKNNIDKFREGFLQKFGERRVPILEALDPDLGVPFDDDMHSEDHELLKGLEFERAQKGNDQISWTLVHHLLMKTWLQNGKRDKWEPVTLTDDDLSGLPGSNLPFPQSASVFCSFVQDKVVFHNVGGATANALTGRFSAFSDEFEEFCRSTASLETVANPDVIFAEVLQVSHRKIDNINRRRQVYGKVIPLNSFPSKDAFLPKDIDVLVRGEEILLFHRLSGKRVIPRMPTAFNYHHNEMALFRFLCGLQYKSIRGNFDFDPEKVYPGLDFYPRIEYGKAVLSLAKWHLSSNEIAELTGKPLSISRLHLFCRKRGIPARISAGNGDQQLVFDLSNDEEAIFFLESLNDQANPMITEFIADNDMLVKEKGNFNDQFVLSLFNKGAVYSPAVMVDGRPIVRDFEPGTEWLYLKLYATHESIEQILIETILPWINSNERRIRQWFFVRYHDPRAHLRLRLRVDQSNVKDVQHELQSLIMSHPIAALVQKAYFDIYRREIERYSANLMEDVENVFYRGSELVAARLAINAAEEETVDLLWPIVHCYEIIATFFENEFEAINKVCQWAAQAFFREHGGNKNLKRSMDDQYRGMQTSLLAAITDVADDGQFAKMKESLFRLSQAAAEVAFDRGKLIADVIHMQVNRIFKSEQRRHEVFIWHCLLKMAVTQSKRATQIEHSVMNVR